MQARYYVWGLLGGAAVTIAPGSLLWVAPLAGALAHMAFDATSPEEREMIKQQLLGAAERLQLPMPFGANKAELLLADQQRAATLGAARKQGQPTAVEIDPFEQELAAAQQPRQERDPLLRTLEQEPHRLIIGRSRGGKTTIIHDMATNWAKDEHNRVIVLDPDAMPGLWPGCTVAGHGNDIEGIERLLHVVAHEYARRQVLRGQGQLKFRPIHLVIDEAHEILPIVRGGIDIFEDITRRGAKHGIYLTIGVQDKQVTTLGLEGKSELIKNFIVADVLKDLQGQRKAVIKDPVTGKKTAWSIPVLQDPEDLAREHKRKSVETVRLSQQPQAAPKPVAKPVPKPEPTDDTFLADLLAQTPPTSPTEQSVTVVDGPTGVTVNVTQTAASTSTEPPRQARPRRATTQTNMRRRAAALSKARKAETLEETYARLYREGVPSFRQAYAQAGGGRDEALAAWRAAKGTAKEQER